LLPPCLTVKLFSQFDSQEDVLADLLESFRGHRRIPAKPDCPRARHKFITTVSFRQPG
jgi:hypothetical protein